MTELVPFDPTIGITVVAGIMLTVFMAVMVFLALAPIVSAKWAQKLNVTADGHGSSTDPNTAD